MIRFCAVLVFCLGVFQLPGFGAARAAAAEMDHGARINVAGRQRMLTQRMAKAMGEFEEALAGLREGSAAMGLVAPPNDTVIDQLRIVSEIWAKLEPGLNRMARGPAAKPGDFAQVAALNDPLLVEMNKAVGAYLLPN